MESNTFNHILGEIKQGCDLIFNFHCCDVTMSQLDILFSTKHLFLVRPATNPHFWEEGIQAATFQWQHNPLNQHSGFESYIVRRNFYILNVKTLTLILITKVLHFKSQTNTGMRPLITSL